VYRNTLIIFVFVKMQYSRFVFIIIFALHLIDASAEDAPKKCRYVNLKTIPLTLNGNALYVNGAINGTEFPMAVDTGSDKTRLLRSAVDSLGLRLAHTNSLVAGGGGESVIYVATVNQFSVGAMTASNLRLAVAWSTSGINNVAALVGADVLMQDDLELSFNDGKLRFFRPLDCGDSFLAYWNPNASYVTFETDSPENLSPIVTVELNGKPIRALVDTGSTTSVVTLAAAQRAGITPTSPGVIKDAKVGGIGEHRFQTWLAPFSSFAIGPEVTEHLHLRVGNFGGSLESDKEQMVTSPWIGEPPEMIIGMDFLKHHRILFSKAQHRLYFSYEGGVVFEPARPQGTGSNQ